MNPVADICLRLATPEGYRLGRTMSGLRLGRYDPTVQLSDGTFRMALRTPDGPASVEIVQRDAELAVRSWGAGAAWLGPRAEELAGLGDDPRRFAPQDPRLRRLQRRYPGMHLPRLPRVFDRIVQVVLLQLVTWQEGARSWRRMVVDLGEQAPGPFGLALAPDPRTLASTPYYVLVEHGILPRQARTIIHLARHVKTIEAAAERGPGTLAETLGSWPGVGPWTVQFVLGSALGDPDAVPVGDYNLPRTVSWALAGEERGSEQRMLELLEPFRGHRYRVIRLLWMSGVRAPRRAPRRAVRRLTP